jgi:kanamycin kinase
MPEPPDAPEVPTPPPNLERLAPGWSATLAYRLVPTITTWRLTSPEGAVRFAKVDIGGRYPTLRGESERMVWAAPYLPVPKVVALDEDGGSSILLTEALPGRDATHPAWRSDVAALVAALGRGLRAFHDTVGEEWCPFRFDVERALDHVARRVAADDVNPAGFHEEHRHLSPAQALAELVASAPADEDLVVCHGDYCPPNALLSDGEVTGYVDLGELGAADRWWDVATGGWSTCWNFGDRFEGLFYESYGIAPDPARIRFFRLLYDLVS